MFIHTIEAVHRVAPEGITVSFDGRVTINGARIIQSAFGLKYAAVAELITSTGNFLLGFSPDGQAMTLQDAQKHGVDAVLSALRNIGEHSGRHVSIYAATSPLGDASHPIHIIVIGQDLDLPQRDLVGNLTI